MQESSSLGRRTFSNWTLEILIAFAVTALATAYFGLVPGSPLPLYQIAILVVLEAVVYAGWGRVASDSF